MLPATHRRRPTAQEPSLQPPAISVFDAHTVGPHPPHAGRPPLWRHPGARPAADPPTRRHLRKVPGLPPSPHGRFPALGSGASDSEPVGLPDARGWENPLCRAGSRSGRFRCPMPSEATTLHHRIYGVFIVTDHCDVFCEIRRYQPRVRHRRCVHSHLIARAAILRNISFVLFAADLSSLLRGRGAPLQPAHIQLN